MFQPTILTSYVVVCNIIKIQVIWEFIFLSEGNHTEADIPQAAHKPIPRDGEIPAGENRTSAHWLWGHKVGNDVKWQTRNVFVLGRIC